MGHELVNPNLHVALIHAPMGLVFIGVLIELFSFLGWRRSGFRTAGRWMILLGALTAVPAALTGVYALQDVARFGVDPVVAAGRWHDVLAATPLIHTQNGEPWEHLIDHAWQQGIATGALLFAVLIWLSCSDHYRAKLHIPIFLIVLVACGLMALGGWNGGESVYSHGTGVNVDYEMASPASAHLAPATNASSVTTRPADLLMGKADDPEHTMPRTLRSKIEFVAPPMQMHVIFAGLTISMAVVALGLGIRGATTIGKSVDNMDDLAAALGPLAANDPYVTSTEHQTALRQAAIVPGEHTLPSARFWLLATLLALITVSIGAYLLAGPHGIGSWKLQELIDQIRNPDQNPAGPMKLTRRLAHVIAGSAIVLLTILLAIFGRFAPRRKFFVLFLGLLLLAAAAAQVWVGILLLYDTNSGRLDGFH